MQLLRHIGDDEVHEETNQKIAETIGIAVAYEEFHCRGEFAKFHKGRPNETDIAEVYEFAKCIVNQEG